MRVHAMEATFVALGEVSSSRRAWSRQWRGDVLFIFQFFHSMIYVYVYLSLYIFRDDYI